VTIAPQPATPQRPALVTAIGWIFAGFGGMGIFAGLMAEAMSWSGAFSPEKMHFGSQPGPWQIFERVFRYYWLIGIVEVVLGIVLIVVGLAFIKLRPWARPVAELIAWLAIAYNLAFGGWWVWAVASLKMEGGASFLGPMMAGMGIAGMLIGSLPIVLLIVGLRGRTVRGAFG
jgi:hypothetical protein